MYRSRIAIVLFLSMLMGINLTQAAGFQGTIVDEEDEPVNGATVTIRFGAPFQARTVFASSEGRYRVTGIPAGTDYLVRVKRIGWRDVITAGRSSSANKIETADFTMIRHTDPALVAEQLPANRWFELLLDRIESPKYREVFARKCLGCHQQGSIATRMPRKSKTWDRVLEDMARMMHAEMHPYLRKRIPDLINTVLDPENAVPILTKGWQEPGFAPPPPEHMRGVIIDEFQVGGPIAYLHDLIMHPSGDVYSVDFSTDTLYRLDPSVPGGEREAFPIPGDGVPIGGVMGYTPWPKGVETRMAPHSLQVDSKGNIWMTMASGNRIGKFDPTNSSFSFYPSPEGDLPHTLRIDDRDRIWYTMAATNSVGVYDSVTGQHDVIHATGATEEEPFPFAYGIDLSPTTGDAWFSQLFGHRIGRIDPKTYEVTMYDTPFKAPRRIRFDSKGMLWIAGFSSNLISRFNPETEEFKNYTMPRELGIASPYAVNVDRRTDTIWISEANSDTMLSFNPKTEEFTIYPMPTQGTYTRDSDFDEEGRIWVSNSNVPAWQIENGVATLIRLTPPPSSADSLKATPNNPDKSH